jgi:hypothetical protein
MVITMVELRNFDSEHLRILASQPPGMVVTFLGNDFRNISNKEVIALNQDPLGVQGYKRLSHLVPTKEKD